MEIVNLEPTTIARVRMSSSPSTVARDIRAVVEVYGDWTENESELRTDLFHMLRPD